MQMGGRGSRKERQGRQGKTEGVGEGMRKWKRGSRREEQRRNIDIR